MHSVVFHSVAIASTGCNSKNLKKEKERELLKEVTILWLLIEVGQKTTAHV